MQTILKEESARSPLRPRRGRSASLARPEPYPGAQPRPPRPWGLQDLSQGWSQHDGLTQPQTGLPEVDPDQTQAWTPSPPPPLVAPTRSLTSQLMEAETDEGAGPSGGGGSGLAIGPLGPPPANRDEDLEEIPVLSEGSLGLLTAGGGMEEPGRDGPRSPAASEEEDQEEEESEEEEEVAEGEGKDAMAAGGYTAGDARARRVEETQLEESEAEAEEEDSRSDNPASAEGMSAESDMTATVAFKPLAAHRQGRHRHRLRWRQMTRRTTSRAC